MPNNIFVKGNVKLTVDDIALQFKNKNVSAFGITGLPWAPLSPDKYFGAECEVDVRPLIPKAVQYHCKGFLMKERTAYGDYMGIRMTLADNEVDEMRGIISEYGHYPADYNRKYPRIPAAPEIPSFPLRVIGLPSQREFADTPLIFDVKNLSLGGILLSTENPFSLSLEPGQRMAFHFEPRGDFSVQIEVQGMICRIMEDIHVASKNMNRMFGVKFTRVNEENRVAFLELIKDILQRLKAGGG